MTPNDTARHLIPARLPTNEATSIILRPDPTETAALAAQLDLLGLRKLRFEGALTPQGSEDWRLTGRLGATVVQPCSVTLAPVTTRIDVPVERLYLADFDAPTAEEVEMPEDDSQERLPERINLLDVIAEALALELPDFPRADGVDLGEAVFTAPDAMPLTDEAVKPFAGLAALKKHLEE